MGVACWGGRRVRQAEPWQSHIAQHATTAQDNEEDIRLLRWFLDSVLWLMPRARQLQPYDIIDELARNLHKEIDLREE